MAVYARHRKDIYGLESNGLVDERRDPIKATWAAARYLKDMYDIYKDWNLVIAAYNCGRAPSTKPSAAREGKPIIGGNLQLSAQRDTRLRARLHCRQLRNDLLLQAQHLPHGNRHSEATDTVQVSRNLHFESRFPTYAASAWTR